jgi:hypothetical protein
MKIIFSNQEIEMLEKARRKLSISVTKLHDLFAKAERKLKSISNRDMFENMSEEYGSVTKTPEGVTISLNTKFITDIVEFCTDVSIKYFDLLEGFAISCIGIFKVSKELMKDLEARWQTKKKVVIKEIHRTNELLDLCIENEMTPMVYSVNEKIKVIVDNKGDNGFSMYLVRKLESGKIDVLTTYNTPSKFTNIVREVANLNKVELDMVVVTEATSKELTEIEYGFSDIYKNRVFRKYPYGLKEKKSYKLGDVIINEFVDDVGQVVIFVYNEDICNYISLESCNDIVGELEKSGKLKITIIEEKEDDNEVTEELNIDVA